MDGPPGGVRFRLPYCPNNQYHLSICNSPISDDGHFLFEEEEKGGKLLHLRMNATVLRLKHGAAPGRICSHRCLLLIYNHAPFIFR